MSAPQRLAGLAEVAENYDLFAVDQFGVLHDGVAPYPGAAEVLSRLKDAGRKVLLLSNSGKRAAGNEGRLTRLGFPPTLYDLLLTSGEAAWRMFASGRMPGGGPVPARVFVISRDRDLSMIAGLKIEAVARPEEAEAILIAGSEAPEVSLADYAALLRPAASAGLPGFCLNPDATMLTPKGKAFGAGRIADLYEEMGGAVVRIGKPFPEIYRLALEALPTPPKRVLAIGDSIEHDIVGARAAGWASALVLSGIHAGESADSITALCRHHGATPDFILPTLEW